MIPVKKVRRAKEQIVEKCLDCQGKGCSSCFSFCTYIDKMAEIEIPVDYWFREMKDFYGEENFKQAILQYSGDISGEYDRGSALCLTGERGRGKTMAACSVLKKALLEDYTGFYVTLVEAVSKLMSPESYNFRRLVRRCDFLVIDEVDQRFFPKQGSMELYGNHFENMVRSRFQNKLPTIICTNSSDTGQIFGGEFGKSFESLGSQFVRVLPAGGKDARKGREKL